MQITVGLWWETSQDNISEFTDLILDEFFGIQSWFHLSANQLRDVFDMENLLGLLFSFFFFFFNFLLFFLLLNYQIFW